MKVETVLSRARGMITAIAPGIIDAISLVKPDSTPAGLSNPLNIAIDMR